VAHGRLLLSRCGPSRVRAPSSRTTSRDVADGRWAGRSSAGRFYVSPRAAPLKVASIGNGSMRKVQACPASAPSVRSRMVAVRFRPFSGTPQDCDNSMSAPTPSTPATFEGSSRLHFHPRGKGQGEILVVLVHGLGGGGYKTWANLPTLLLAGPLPVDVGVFDYTSGLRRFSWGRSAAIPAVVRELADELVACSYPMIVLAGHSLGGVISQQVVRQLHSQESAPYKKTRKVAGLILLAAPRAGSLRVPWWLQTKDARYLRAHSEVAIEIDNFFTQHVESRCTPEDSHPRLSIPTFAGMASSDFLVTEFSAGFGLPADQKRHFSGTHSSIVKIKDEGDSVLVWIREQVSRVQELRRAQESTVTKNYFPMLVNVQFSGHPLESSWNTAYKQAREAVDRASDIRVLDSRTPGLDAAPSVLLRAVHASEIDREAVKCDLQADDIKQRADGRVSLGIALIGNGGELAVQEVFKLIGNAPPGATRWIVSVKNSIELRRILHHWLTETVDLLGTTAAFSSRDDLRNAAAVNRESPRSHLEAMSDQDYLFRERP
jgi:pimeloyl-ACP methyl ester carboxylesterase